MRPADCLGAHVSIAGGLARAPARGAAVGATAIQIFTRTPNQWRERQVAPAEAQAFQAAVRAHRIAAVVAHANYLINPASPDRQLRARSARALAAELRRAAILGIPRVVLHPGSFQDDRSRGLARCAALLEETLSQVPGPRLVLETTSGAGTQLGARFEELAQVRDRLSPAHRGRVGYCADTCHLFAAGYDLRHRFDRVWEEWDRVLGLAALEVLHLNDSQGALGSRRDRHAWIGEGRIGPEAFRRLMREEPFRSVVKIIETPKGDDAAAHDRRMLRRLRRWAPTVWGAEPVPGAPAAGPTPARRAARCSTGGELPR